MKKSIWFWLCFITAIILGVYFATRIIMITSGRGRLATIRHISITTDQPDQDMAPLAAALGVPPGSRSYATRLTAVNDRIGAVPGVRTSAVRRLANGNLGVHVQIHETIALWTDDGEIFFPLSADGTIIQTPRRTRTPGAIVFRGPVPDDIGDIARVAGHLGKDLDYMEWIENRRFNIHTTGGVTILLPQVNPNAAIGSLMVLNKKNGILSKKIRIIDMRDAARILIKE